MKKLILYASVILVLSGCLLEEKLSELNDRYCAETNEEKRKVLIRLIQVKFPEYPEGGLCKIEEIL